MTSKKRSSSRSSKKTTESKRNKATIDGSDDTPKIIDLQNEESSNERSKGKKEPSSSNGVSVKRNKKSEDSVSCRFVGAPIPDDEARRRWPHRYEKKKQRKNDDEEALLARCHYSEAEVDDCAYNLYDDVHVKAEDDKPNYIARIVEFFESTDKELYFTAQWFYRAEDTVIKDHANLIDDRRVFQSDIRDDNPLECIVCKLKLARITPNINEAEKKAPLPPCDFFYDMKYAVPYSTIENLPPEHASESPESSSTISSEASCDVGLNKAKTYSPVSSAAHRSEKDEMTLLDLYSGCGAMSTGLCLGAALSGVNLITRWAVDVNEHACESLKLNHPETQVRNESADDFLTLLKEWEKLCKGFSLLGTRSSKKKCTVLPSLDDKDTIKDDSKVPTGEFEVGTLVGICFGDPNETGKQKLHFKVRWKGYGSSDDTWEPVEGLSNCQGKIKDFVTNGYKSNIIPLPGDVDVICGGPPCQGVSGFNRFRNKEAPLDDPKNSQLIVFMNIVNYLKPRYVLMENVVDILKFAGGFLGRYALSRLVAMGYQTRLGMMAAGCYGLPQFRMRAFFWGACPTEKLPQFPLPTHDVVVRGGVPNEFEQSTVAYDENHHPNLEKALLLGDAISDLPPVTNYETRDEMPYVKPAETDFQKQIRLRKPEVCTFTSFEPRTSQRAMLYDHRPLQLNEDDYQRVCRIPKQKGACFRNLPGVLVREDKKVEWDESVERVLLPSGKPLVPDYAMSFVGGTSSKPFSRLWWDETVPTVVTRAEPHNQSIMHPEQDRVLSIRENARLQGFPDYYKLCGPVKERYIQVGNAVAVPVARALGYALGLACRGAIDEQPMLTLPSKFPSCLYRSASGTIEIQDANC